MGQVSESTEAAVPYSPNPAEKLLITALRSGEYRQDTNTLRTNRGFCCLGVACDVYRKVVGVGEWGKIQSNFVFNGKTNNHHMNLPKEVQQWLGWSDPDGSLDVPEQFPRGNYLTNQNDSGATFAEIADLIEAGKVRRA